MAAPSIVIGRVRSVNPRAREVRVEILGGYTRAYDGLAWIRFERGPAGPIRCKIARIRSDATTAIVELGAGLPRDTVGQLRGANVVALPEEIPARPGNEWRLDELVGMAVVMPGGESLGTVCEVYEGPANDAFAVKRPGGGQCVLPAIPELVLAVDRDGGRIEVGDVAPFIVED